MSALRFGATALALVLTLCAAAPPAARGQGIVVPFDLIDGHIFVTAHVDGRPLRLVVDTGAGDVLAADTAAALGLRRSQPFTVYGTGERGEPAYSAHVDAVELGGAVLHDQHFTVLPFDDLRSAEGVDRFDGLLGHELFDRYAVRIDYAAHTLTLEDPSGVVPGNDDVVVPFSFYGTMPEVQGTVDGIAGRFTIDTGDRGSLSLLVPFVEEHALAAHYRSDVEGIAGWGIGGPVRAKLARVTTLSFQGVNVHDLVARLPLAKHGFFTSRAVDGNVGYGVLHRFIVTFDYAQKRMLLAPVASANLPDAYDRSGMWLVAKPSGFGVADVIARGPAALAGIRVGDVIATIDGRLPRAIGLAAERAALREQPPGTLVALRVLRGDVVFDVTLKLADLL